MIRALTGLSAGFYLWAAATPVHAQATRQSDIVHLLTMLVDYAYLGTPVLFIAALLIGLCRRHWTLVMFTLILGGAFLLNTFNSGALPGYTESNASLYLTSNAVFLAIAAVLTLIVLRLLFMDSRRSGSSH